ncbi:MAG: butyrate kinase, partial [Eubacteriales bacterium]|nr:butyrate kinase [Eubacteriales bacterium]
MSYRILAINPGSTSTKIALYDDEKELFVKALDHSAEEIDKYDRIVDQLAMRKNVVMNTLEESGYEIKTLDAIVGRGGMLPPVKSGAYRVNELMIDRLKHRPLMEHASNLGALIAFEIASSIEKPAYIYDSVKVDELTPIARISGMPVLPRISTSHALNSRAMAIKAAKEYGREYSDMNILVVHMGGGISLSIHENGRMVDIISDDE